MNKNEAEQVARIIYNVFQHEEQVDPRTVALMFQYMGRVDPEGTYERDDYHAQKEIKDAERK